MTNETEISLEAVSYTHLSQWSAATGTYRELFVLTEGKDEEGHPVYQNKETFKNTLDNLGKYKITEKKAPKGCILTGQEWTCLLYTSRCV